MRPIFTFTLALLILTACSSNPPAPQAPQVTVTSQVTVTLSPPTQTSTATLPPAPAIELAPFTAETKNQLPTLNVPEWEKASGRKITPADIMDGASASERPFPSETLVTGFLVHDNPDGSREVSVEVDGKVKSLKELPFVYDTVMLTDAQAIYPELFAKLAKEWGAPVDKLLAVKLRINTVGGELELVMVTDGDSVNATNGRNSRADAISKIAGADFEFPATPIVKNRKTDETDGIGSILAGKIALLNADEIKTVGELMVSTDLTNPVEFNKLQKKLRGTWLIMGGIGDMKYVKVRK